MALYYILFLAIAQGITEFLPISSSAHLILGRDLMMAIDLPLAEGSAADQLAFDVALHVGSLGAVMLYFWRDAVEMIMGLIDGVVGRGGQRFRLLLLVIVGTIPRPASWSRPTTFGPLRAAFGNADHCRCRAAGNI